ncbi:MAG: electron transfer flavoprotein subunit alpha/FixB family protein [Bacillota bacterium]
MSKIMIISEIAETAYEMLAKARELAAGDEKIAVFVLGDEEIGQEAVSYGADTVKLMTLPEGTVWEAYVPEICKEAATIQPELIMVGATRRGKDLAAQVAAKLDAACVTECKNFEYSAGKIVMKRIIYGGLAEKTLECTQFPVVATVAAKTFSKWDTPDTNRQGSVAKLEVPAEVKVKVVERRPKPEEKVNIKEAKIVVGVGRGFAEQREIIIAEELAESLKGVVACSRPIAEDLHWLPEERYIGISGQVIKPSVYVAAGISGQVQHVYGIRDAKTIVAVDKNENAPIFQVADYYIVGDLKEVLPAITKAAQEAQGS